MVLTMKRTERDNAPISLRNLRLDAGLSGVKLAQRLGLPSGNISRLERGQLNPTAATLTAYLVGVDRPDLAARVTAASAVVQIGDRAANPTSPRLFRLFAAVGDTEMAALMASCSRSLPVPDRAVPARQ
jgi:transcriptional regulator with XRE-family HTH domain